MELRDYLTIGALLVGPTAAVLITLWLQKRNNTYNQRVWIFQTLMAFRRDQFNADRIKALQTIDVVFNNVPEVRRKWKEYYEALSDPQYADGKNNGIVVWNRKQNEMLAEMAQFLGYGKEIKYEEIERAYAPKLFSDNAERGQKAAIEILRVLENSENLGQPRKHH